MPQIFLAFLVALLINLIVEILIEIFCPLVCPWLREAVDQIIRWLIENFGWRL